MALPTMADSERLTICADCRREAAPSGFSCLARLIGRSNHMTNRIGRLTIRAVHPHRSLILVFDATDASPFLELKQTLHAQLPHTSRLETLMPFSKGFIVAGGGINGYLGVYENMVGRRGNGERKHSCHPRP